MPLKFSEALLRESFAVFRSCGAGRKECIVYWAGPVVQPDLVDRLIHPDHVASVGYYEIAQEWLNGIWFHLNSEQIEVRMQVHTHKHSAFHSDLDNDFPFLQTAGFLSLVIPGFALGPLGLEGAYLARLEQGGGWSELDAGTALEII